MPTSSTHAIEPPPAPMAVTPTTGIITGTPPTCSLVLQRGRLPSTTARSALVPPTSRGMTLGSPAWPATYAAPMTPAPPPPPREGGGGAPGCGGGGVGPPRLAGHVRRADDAGGRPRQERGDGLGA